MNAINDMDHSTVLEEQSNQLAERTLVMSNKLIYVTYSQPDDLWTFIIAQRINQLDQPTNESAI